MTSEPISSDPVAALRRADPKLATLIDGRAPLDFATWRTRWKLDPFRSLARGIVGQQISGAAAEAIYGRLQALIGEREPVAAIAGATDEELRSIGLSGNKMASLRDLSARLLDGRLRLDAIDDLSDDELRGQLTAVRGIGDWTADLFLLVQLGRPDILPAGDLGIRQAVQRVYGLERLPTEREVRTIGEAWRPYRSTATAYLYASLREPDAT